MIPVINGLNMIAEIDYVSEFVPAVVLTVDLFDILDDAFNWFETPYIVSFLYTGFFIYFEM